MFKKEPLARRSAAAPRPPLLPFRTITSGKMRAMLVVHATRKLLERLRVRPADAIAPSTTILGSWYATVLFWRPQVALWINERTLLPLLIPLAPAASLLDRFPDELAVLLQRLGAPSSFVAAEVEQMAERQVAKTASRSLLGTMNEFSCLADDYRRRHPAAHCSRAT